LLTFDIDLLGSSPFTVLVEAKGASDMLLTFPLADKQSLERLVYDSQETCSASRCTVKDVETVDC
jgi:hypothetical protein